MTREERKQARLEKKKLNKEYKQAKREAKIMAIREKGLEQVKSEYNKICKKIAVSTILFICLGFLGLGFFIPNLIWFASASLNWIATAIFSVGTALSLYRVKQCFKKYDYEDAIAEEELNIKREKLESIKNISTKLEGALTDLVNSLNMDITNMPNELDSTENAEQKPILTKRQSLVMEIYERSKQSESEAEQTENKNGQVEEYLHNVDFWFNEDDDETQITENGEQANEKNTKDNIKLSSLDRPMIKPDIEVEPARTYGLSKKVGFNPVTGERVK